MRSLLRYILPGLFLALISAGCAKQPSQEINAARSAVDAAVGEGAAKYAPEEAARLDDSLNIAMGEVEAQRGKLFKNYTKAKQMLAKVKTDADSVKAGLAAKRDEAKQRAIAAQESAKSAVRELSSLVSKMPKGKAGKEDAQGANAALNGVEEALTDVQKKIDTEDYPAAINSANAIENKAASMSAELNSTLRKTSAARNRALAKKMK